MRAVRGRRKGRHDVPAQAEGRAVTIRAMASLLLTLVLWLSGGVMGLRDIQLSVPEAVNLGDTTTLGCRWLLDDGETLYTVKWYRGAQEFFRYIPKELPHTRVFSQPGINVDVSRSGAQQVVLHSATRALGGRYRCEVSADAPYFHTVYKTAFMHVVELPDSAPLIVAQKSWYTAGDTLRANCSSPAAAPPANLTWLLNGNEVKGFAIPPIQPASTKSHSYETSLEDVNTIIFSPWNTLPGYEEPVTDNVIDIPAIATFNASRYWAPEPTVRTRKPSESKNQIVQKVEQEVFANGTADTVEEKSNRSSSASQLVLRVQGQHFRKGRLNLTCVARVYSVYSAKAELVVEEERPQIAPVMGSRDSNAGCRRRGALSSVWWCTLAAFVVGCCLKGPFWSVR